jgi:hypothetical protein
VTREDWLFGFAAVSACGVPIAAIAAVYTALQYHQPPAATGNAAVSVAAQNQAPTIFPYIPWRSRLLAGASVICLLLALYLAHQWGAVSGPRGPKGDQGIAGPEGKVGATGPAGLAGPAGVQGSRGEPGSQGIAGPPGPQGASAPTAPFDARLASMQRQISSLLRERQLEHGISQLQSLLMRYDETTKIRLEIYKSGGQNDNGIPISASGSFRLANDGFGTIEQSLKTAAKSYLNVDLDLNKHQRFDDNHHFTTPGADDISDPRIQEDYRREYDRYSTAKSEILALIEQAKTLLANEQGKIDSDARAISSPQ